MQTTVTDLKLNGDGSIPYEMIPLPKKNVQTQIRKMIVRIEKLEKLAGINNVSQSVEKPKEEKAKPKKKSKK